ncbi:Homoisocitrate dehydrogenase [Methanimicrococcus hongohii]|uniref:3-isopropylmalate dehydrogenase n=1 Tax=Methanimicrococcus hongohii TaxID=3028295 RepID=A0AA96ZS46_9EURY|nr:isocitrate/isopropylmalate family dehydrogenase [Methanimicrococcus sp. Hf6]WNY23030.1 Homoisocitrate dehydrogenase [Methanimicrococcus sp. Hf6]
MRTAIIEGDGIGKEVIPEAVAILDYFNETYDWGIEKVPVEVGFGKWERTGSAITDEDIAVLKSCNSILFGAITTVIDPSYKSVLLRIRKELDLYANIRPILPIPGIYKLLKIKDRKESDVNMIIVRENSEGLYSGIEEIGDEKSTTTRVITKKASVRIAAFASNLAAGAERKNSLTVVHKSNVLKSDKLFLDSCKQTAESKGVNVSDKLVDIFAYDMIMTPEKYDVVVTTNLFGDILSDLGAVLLGSIGLAPSANFGDNQAFFEPVHGSAPDIAGKGIANPMAAILSLKMMFEWMGKKREACLVNRAVSAAIHDKIVTPDLGGKYSTKEVGDFILSKVRQLDAASFCLEDPEDMSKLKP